MRGACAHTPLPPTPSSAGAGPSLARGGVLARGAGRVEPCAAGECLRVRRGSAGRHVGTERGRGAARRGTARGKSTARTVSTAAGAGLRRFPSPLALGAVKVTVTPPHPSPLLWLRVHELSEPPCPPSGGMGLLLAPQTRSKAWGSPSPDSPRKERAQGSLVDAQPRQRRRVSAASTTACERLLRGGNPTPGLQAPFRR